MKEHANRVMRKIGQVVGLIPVEVDFDLLAQQSEVFDNKWVQTNGIYHPVSRRLVHEVGWVAGASMLPDTRVERHLVLEQGVMTDDRMTRAIRVLREFNYGKSQDKAKEAVVQIPEGQNITLQGYVREGFPGEYYLRTGLISA